MSNNKDWYNRNTSRRAMEEFCSGYYSNEHLASLDNIELRKLKDEVISRHEGAINERLSEQYWGDGGGNLNWKVTKKANFNKKWGLS